MKQSRSLASFQVPVVRLLVLVGYNNFTEFPNSALATNYINNNIEAGSKVEAFESELYFQVKGINFHYPSDLVSMQYVRKWNIDPRLVIDYDPMTAHPDYLVIGPYATFWHVYDDILNQEKITLITDAGGYKIYRVNNSNNN